MTWNEWPHDIYNICRINLGHIVYFEVNEPQLRPGISGPSVRILGMIDRLEPKVNLMKNK